jgi:DNA-binding transcriptional MerR regulator
LTLPPYKPQFNVKLFLAEDDVTNNGYTCQQVMGITGLSRRQLSYWRKTGLVVPSQHTSGGHGRYSFTDLVALKTAKRLIDAGVSVQRIRKSLTSLTAFLPACEAPLSELSLVATGDMVLVLHRNSTFEALTGQEWILPVAELAREAALWRGETEPQQTELFPNHEEAVNS